jgi:hypothetical protein
MRGETIETHPACLDGPPQAELVEIHSMAQPTDSKFYYDWWMINDEDKTS